MKDILIVEDSKLIRKKIEDILEKLGYNPVAGFSRGEDALEYVCEEKPDLIIMDIDLKGRLNGLQTAHRIMENEDIPVVFLTGSEGFVELQEPTLTTITAYLSKPFTAEELRNNLELTFYKEKILNKIKKTNEEQRVLLDNIKNQVWYMIDPWTYGRVNKAHAHFFGYQKQEMENNKINQLFSEKQARKLIKNSKKAFREKIQIKAEERFKNNEGENRLLAIRMIPKMNDSETVEYVVCSAEDITEKRKMQQELIEREERFLSIIATLPDILILFNKKGEYLNIWTGQEENLYAPRSELIGKNFEEVLPEGPAREIRKNLDQTLKYNKLQVFEYDLDVLSGHRYFEARMTAISRNKAVMIVRDITERKNASKELEVQRAYFKQLFENSPDAIAILDTDNNVINVNESFENMFGYKEEEILEENINKLITDEGHTLEAEIFSRQVTEGNIVHKETTRKTARGNNLEVSLLAYPIRLNSKQLGMYAIYRDISARKELENNLRESKNKIEKLHEIAVKMETCDSEEKIYELTVNSAENILNFDACVLDIVEDGKFKVKATGSGVKEDGVENSAPIDEGIAGRVYQSGESHISRDIREESEAAPADEEYRSALTVPIGKFGIFQVISNKIGDFDEVDLELCELLISHTSAALKRIRAEKRIKYLGFHDSLTDLYNRAYFEKEMERLDTERNLPFSIIIGDLNNLKIVNDEYGHNAGDKVIVEVADKLKKCCRQEDILARWGGDEFGLLLPQTPQEVAQEVLNRIQKQLTGLSYKDLEVNMALGFATKYDVEEDIQETFKRADDNMYENKAEMREEQRKYNF